MFISWITHHGRSEALARELNLEALFLSPEIARRGLPFRYWAAMKETRSAIKARKPKSLFVMLPPAPALIIAILCKGRKTELVADLHTGFFSDKKWRWFARPALWMLRGSTVLVTNDVLRERCERAGVKAIVMHDVLSPTSATSRAVVYSGPVICPLSYANDEPIEALVEAAERCSEFTFLFTGNAPQELIRRAPSNVKFCGYISISEYDNLMASALLVVAMTNRDLTMQRAGYEALMAGKPQVTADFTVLREFLGNAALYADPEKPAEIAHAIRVIAGDPARYAEEALQVLTAAIAAQTETISLLKAIA